MIGRLARRAAVVLLSLAAVGCLGRTTDSRAPIDIGAPGAWSVHRPMPTARQEVAVAVLAGRIFVIGGFGALAEPVPTVEVYDPVTDLWETRAPLPAPTHHPAAAVIGDRLFVVGGYTGGRVNWTPQRVLYEYDAARDSWATRAAMPTARGALGAAALNGRLHAVGGAHTSPTAAHEVYDPQTDRWSGLAPMPTARDHLAVVVFDGRLWAIGGRAAFLREQYPAVEIYDSTADRWDAGVPLPTGRGGLAAAAAGGRIFVFGGEAPLKIFSATEMFEPASQRWIAKDPMRTPRHGIGAVVVGRRIWISGGGTEPGYAPTSANEAFTP